MRRTKKKLSTAAWRETTWPYIPHPRATDAWSRGIRLPINRSRGLVDCGLIEYSDKKDTDENSPLTAAFVSLFLSCTLFVDRLQYARGVRYTLNLEERK